MEIRPLLPGDERGAFRSGDAALDRYFQQFAGQNQFRHRIGVTYVALQDERIVGYATVSPAVIETEKLPAAVNKRLPANPVPVLRLARLATDESVRGQGVGLALLRYVLELAIAQSTRVGCTGVLVDAKPDAVAFYRKYGFVELEAEARTAHRDQTPLFLAIGSIA